MWDCRLCTVFVLLACQSLSVAAWLGSSVLRVSTVLLLPCPPHFSLNGVCSPALTLTIEWGMCQATWLQIVMMIIYAADEDPDRLKKVRYVLKQQPRWNGCCPFCLLLVLLILMIIDAKSCSFYQIRNCRVYPEQPMQLNEETMTGSTCGDADWPTKISLV